MNPFAHLATSLSASRIGTYCRCPLRYYLQYVKKHPWEHISAAMLLGRAIDTAAKDVVVALKQGRDGVTPQEFFLEAYESAFNEADAPVRWPARFDREKLSNLGQRLMEALEPVLFSESRVSSIAGHDVTFTIPLLDEAGEPLMPTPLVGVFDFVQETTDGLVPLELKTSGTRTQFLQNKLARDLQALIYGLAAKSHGGHPQVKYINCVKLKTPEIVESENQITEDQLRWVRGVIVGVQRAIDAGVFVARPSSIECASCPFQSACAKSCGIVRVAPRRIFAG